MKHWVDEAHAGTQSAWTHPEDNNSYCLSSFTELTACHTFAKQTSAIGKTYGITESLYIREVTPKGVTVSRARRDAMKLLTAALVIDFIS